MTHWTQPIGDTPLNRTQRLAALDAHNAKLLARVARETGNTLPPRQAPGATAGGDQRALRGIPAIGRGVTGAITGTNPNRMPD
jgi:hypothetical protein